MCGILVSTDHETKREDFVRGMDAIVQRGPDQSKIVSCKDGWIGFQRLAIMDLSEKGMQPFEKDGAQVVCNGEIYGFEKWKKILSTYTFATDSDCEILIPMYETYGLSMFEMLDAEFAMVLHTKEGEWIAARDPIGIRPLFYGYTEHNKICFGSTVASLMPVAKDIHAFPPGHYYYHGDFIPYTRIELPFHVIHDSEEVVCQNIHDLLVEGVKKRMDSDAKIGYLLSGGLDSSLVCAIAQKYSDQPIRTFAIGMDTDAIDLKYARKAAEYIGSEHTEFYMSEKDILEALPEVVKTLESWDITTIRASLGMYILCQKIHETTDIKVLLTGEISDELFGYKYTDFAPNAHSFQKEAEKRVRELYMYDVLRADRCISASSLEARVPFGDLAFVRYVMQIDPMMKMNTHHMGKYLLRKAFEKDHILPEEILYRDKAAFSDAVGHSLADDLKKYAEGLYEDHEYEMKRFAYQWHRPFTKESLLYRDLFTSYYPKMDALIQDYWMPNTEWDGCRVTDPSARFLSNYGASGE